MIAGPIHVFSYFRKQAFKMPHENSAGEDDEFKPIAKSIALDSHAQKERDFLARLRTSVVAIYTGTEDRHMNGHIAEFPGVLNADALVFIDHHRNQDLVERTFQNLPSFDRLPVTVTHTTHAPFVSLARSLRSIHRLQFEFHDVQPRRILRPIAPPPAWAVMATVTFTEEQGEKQLSMLVAGGCSAFQMFAFLAQSKVPVHQIITPED